MPKKQQEKAAGIVFRIGHPVADAGDDESAGPIMNLVVKYQPWNYMALYHLQRWFEQIKGREAVIRAYERAKEWNNQPTITEESKKILFGLDYDRIIRGKTNQE